MNATKRSMPATAGQPRNERFEVVVVGGGQAGLAAGYFLACQGRRFTILEAGPSVGTAWRERWGSLVLFTPRRYDALPGLAFPGDPDGYPGRDEVIEYLESYVDTFNLPIEFESAVRSVSEKDGSFILQLDDRVVEAGQVIIATGPFQTSSVPRISADLDRDLFQTHSTGYRRPSDVPEGTVLVVGGGNTGFQIAKEISARKSVYLAVGSRQTPLPQRLLGRDLFSWLMRFGLMEKTVDSRIGRRLEHRDTLIGSNPRELRRRYGVRMKPRVNSAHGRTISFADGSVLDVDAVIWATGYRPDYSWIKLPIFDEHGRLLHRRGVTDAPGLYFLGLTWQHTRGSALLGWVKADAAFIAEEVAARAGDRQDESETREKRKAAPASAPARSGV
jgi:putative flavoprotein involved in K+ transport